MEIIIYNSNPNTERESMRMRERKSIDNREHKPYDPIVETLRLLNKIFYNT